MYLYHRQTQARRENLQNAPSLDCYKEPEFGERPGEWCKWVRPRMDKAESELFFKVRKALDEKGLGHVSDNNIMRYNYCLHTFERSFNQLVQAEELREQLDCQNLNA